MGSTPERMSSLFSMIELTLFTATAYRAETASNQPTRRGRPVVVPTSRPRDAIPAPTPSSSRSSVGNGPDPTRVAYAFITPKTSSTWRGPIPPPVQAPPAIGDDEVTYGYEP